MIANQLWFKVKAYLGHKHLFEKGFFLPSRPFLGKYYFTWVFLPSVLCAAVGKHPSSRVPKILPQIIISSSIGDEEWALICRHTHVLTHTITSLLLARSGVVQGKQPRIHHLTFLFCSIELITVTLLTVDVRSDEIAACSQNSARHTVGTGLSISCHHQQAPYQQQMKTPNGSLRFSWGLVCGEIGESLLHAQRSVLLEKWFRSPSIIVGL